MLDTHMAIDLIGDATFDVYDIAVIVSEDSDFVPAVDFVQEMRYKQVVHVGFGSHMNDLRAKCRHRIDLGKDRAVPPHAAGKERRQLRDDQAPWRTATGRRQQEVAARFGDPPPANSGGRRRVVIYPNCVLATCPNQHPARSH